MGDLLAIKSARLSDFNGKSLNVSDDQSQLFTEVDSDHAKKVYRWFQRIELDARNEGVSIQDKLQDIEPLTQRQQRMDNQFGQNGQDQRKFFTNVS